MDTRETYDSLLRRYAALVWSMCLNGAHGDKEHCRDLFQDVALRLWQHIGELRTDATPHEERAWMEWQVRHVLELAARRRRPVSMDRLPDMADESATNMAEVKATVDDIASLLDADERQLLQMRLKGFSAEEIATEMGITRGAVYQRWHRIVAFLRKALLVLGIALATSMLAVAVVPQWRHAVFHRGGAADTIRDTLEPPLHSDSTESSPASSIEVDWDYHGLFPWGDSTWHGGTVWQYDRMANAVVFYRSSGTRVIRAVMHNPPAVYYNDTLTPDSMNTAMKHAASAAVTMALAIATQAEVAHDFRSVSPQGDTLFCTITDTAQHHVSVRGDEAVWNTPYIRYSDTLEIPSTVEHEGVQYTVTALADSAFYSHNEIKSAVIPISVTAIGRMALAGSGIVELAVHDGVATIGANAFSLVKNVVYHGTAIGAPWGALAVNAYEEEGLFYSDSTRTRVTGCRQGVTQALLPASVCTIGRYAFTGATALTNVTLPEGLDTIERQAFASCPRLGSVTIPSSVKMIGTYAFYGAFKEDGSSRVTIADAECSIGNGAFAYSNVGDVDMGSRVTSIGRDAFCTCNMIDSIIVPNSCTYLAPRAFCYNYSNRLKKIHLPDNLDTIRDELLHGCTHLEEVNIPSTVVYIGEMALAELYNVAEITLPAGLTYIGPWALGDCRRIYNMKVLAPVPPEVCDNTFQGMNANLTLTVPCGSGEAYSGHPYWSYFENIFEDCTATPSVEADTPAIRMENGAAVIEGATGQKVRLFDITGHLLGETTAGAVCVMPLPAAGGYLVQVGNRPAVKIVKP